MNLSAMLKATMPPLFTSGRVLCIDDEASVRVLLESALAAYGYEAVTAGTAVEAFEIMDSYFPDMVIVDYSMPGMNGAQLAKALKQRHPGLKIAMFSGSLDITPAERASVDVFVRKMDGIRSLLSTLRDLAATPVQQPVVVRHGCRRFPRYAVQIPFAAVVKRRGRMARLEGLSLQLGEGGLGGRITGKLEVGEVVRLQIADARLGRLLEPRAEVRYRDGDVYGFAFSGLGRVAQAELRLLCSQLDSAQLPALSA